MYPINLFLSERLLATYRVDLKKSGESLGLENLGESQLKGKLGD